MIDKKFKFNLGAMINTSAVGGGGSTLNLKIQDEGSQVQENVSTINFVGADVQADAGGAGTVIVYVPPPTFASHFNTQDGTTDARVRQSSTTIGTRFISVPTSEGNPFFTNGFANTNNLASPSQAITLSPLTNSNGDVTAMQNSTFTVNVTTPSGTTMETYTTPTITGNGTFTSSSGDIRVTITNYGADATKFKGRVSIFVTFADILSTAGYDGGAFNIIITHTTQSDGTFTFNLNTSSNPTIQAPFFYDTDTIPSFPQNVAISETSATTKSLSGLSYYTTGSTFTVGCDGLDNLNRNTALTSNNFKIIDNSTYGFSNILQSPLPSGAGNANFTGWTNAYNNTGVSYSNTGVTINRSNFRYIGVQGRVNCSVFTVWGVPTSERTSASSQVSLLVDTFGSTSTDTSEDFNDESYRTDSTFVSGSWSSATSLTSGDAMVIQGKLMTPSSAPYQDWTGFLPSGNPNYTGFATVCNYYRRVPESSGLSKASFTLVFNNGSTFVGSNALDDLINSDLEVFIRRINSSDSSANTGASAPPLRLHTANQYNFATFDDGNTVAGSYIRTGSSSGNTIEGTFGSFDCQDGLLIHIRINDSAIELTGFDIVFN